eukprot:983480-Rhodomonas_salina.2
MSGTDLVYGATSRRASPTEQVAISLRACYAMSGTDLANDDVSLCACYAMSGTEIAYGAISLRACYTMPSTDLAYGATSLSESERAILLGSRNSR